MISPLQLSGDANLKMVTKGGGGVSRPKVPENPLVTLVTKRGFVTPSLVKR